MIVEPDVDVRAFVAARDRVVSCAHDTTRFQGVGVVAVCAARTTRLARGGVVAS